MADFASQISQARQAGYSDQEITAYLGKDPTLQGKIGQAKAAGYQDSEIVDHLASAPAKPPGIIDQVVGAAKQYGASIAKDIGQGADAYRADMARAHNKLAAGKPLGLTDSLAPAMDALSAASGIVTGPLHQAFGQTGGDIASMAIPFAGELNEARLVGQAARGAGVGFNTMRNSLNASRASAPVQAANPLAQTVRQFDQARVRPSIAASGGDAKVANAIAENALAGGSARANMAGQVQDVQQSAQRIGQGYGAPADRTAAGEAVQQGVTDFKQRFSERANDLYTPIFQKIADAEVPAREKAAAEAAAQNQAIKTYGLDTPTAKPAAIINPAATTQLVQEIAGRGSSPALKDLFSTPQLQKLQSAVSDPSSLSFQDLRDARTFVREAQTDQTMMPGIGQGNLKRLESALTQDITANAGAIAGPKVARQLQQADQFYRIGAQRIQDALQAFVGKSGTAAPESAYDRIVRAASDRGGADAGRLGALKRSLQPSEWGDVAASVIDRMGRPTAGAPNASEPDAFSLGKFVTAYGGMSERGKALLFGGQQNAQLKAELDNLVSVAGKVKAVERGANASKSGVSLQNAGTLTGLGGGVAAAAMGHFAPLAAELGGLGAMNITGRFLTDPKAVRWLANLSRAQAAGPQATASAVGRLGSAARATPALVPLYQEAQKLLPQPRLPAAASPSSQAQ
jgi:hypothetical protein